MQSTFIFLGVNAQGGVPAMELIACESVDAAVTRARSWLSGHSTCVRVQVWGEDESLIAELERSEA